MIDLEKQINKIVSEQLKSVLPLLDDIKEGDQKEFLSNYISKLGKVKDLDPFEFVEQFSKIKGEKIDIDKLKVLIKNNSNGR